ncbi:hypothetical protein [Ornithinimicrobium tianjinense]|uniref:Uncharacterized protein n=1 Tax=Ornithinimicrobium tianjinense TaxID=1195761 RepID=A0A917BWN7_9MICO|nr:hypothetical protein [Ornithinimicrobium tianjinense]GGF59081.1 hypothetical protein GCM10011366_28720 [Ornithinimicrobium tianjinense]
MRAGIDRVRQDPSYRERARAFRAEAETLDPDGEVARLVEEAAQKPSESLTA